MSRTFNSKLSGWEIKSNFEYDSKFIQLINDRGPLGYYIYNLLRNSICCQFGYYAILNNALTTSIHYRLGKWTRPIKYIEETIEYFGKIGILDKSLLNKKILTSVEIQEDWLEVKQSQRARIPKNLDYWLLSKDTEE